MSGVLAWPCITTMPGATSSTTSPTPTLTALAMRVVSVSALLVATPTLTVTADVWMLAMMMLRTICHVFAKPAVRMEAVDVPSAVGRTRLGVSDMLRRRDLQSAGGEVQREGRGG